MLFFIDVFFELWIYIVVCTFREINHLDLEYEFCSNIVTNYFSNTDCKVYSNSVNFK